MKTSYRFALLILLFISKSTEFCYTEEEHPDKTEGLKKMKKKYLQNPQQNSSLKFFGKEVRSICPNMPKVFIENSDEDQRIVLGSGSFGTVFSFRAEGQQFAVKYTCFEKFVSDRLSKMLVAKNSHKLICVASIIRMAEKEIFFIETDNKEAGKQQNNNLKKLMPIRFELLKTPECSGIRNSSEIIERVVTEYFKLIRGEIENVKGLSEFSDLEKEQNLLPSFPKFYLCYVTKELDIYYVMEKFGNSLYDVISNCPDTIFALDLKKRFQVYLQILYQTFILHQFQRTHCDIKPENILFSNKDYGRVHLVDYGLLSDGLCFGFTPEYQPFEANYSLVNEREIDELTMLYMRQRHDSFSIGMTLLEVEIGEPLISQFMNRYKKIKGFNDLHKNLKEEKFTKTLNTLIDEILTGYYTEIKGDLSEIRRYKIIKEFFNLISQMLQFDYKKRLPVKAAFNHLFLLYKVLKNEDAEIPNTVDERLKNFEEFQKELLDEDWINEYVELLQTKNEFTRI